jgi:hypothetical protein
VQAVTLKGVGLLVAAAANLPNLDIQVRQAILTWTTEANSLLDRLNLPIPLTEPVKPAGT